MCGGRYRTEPFDGSIYSGYEPQRTHPASFRGEPPSTTGAHYFIFAKDSSLSPADPRTAAPASSDATSSSSDSRANARGAKKKLKQQAPDAASTPASLACKVCGVVFKDVKKYNAHINSPKHARRVKAAAKQQPKRR